MGRAFALVLLLAVSLAPTAARQRSRAQAPAAPPLFEVHERSVLELQAAQMERRATSRGLVESYLARIRAARKTVPSPS